MALVPRVSMNLWGGRIGAPVPRPGPCAARLCLAIPNKAPRSVRVWGKKDADASASRGGPAEDRGRGKKERDESDDEHESPRGSSAEAAMREVVHLQRQLLEAEVRRFAQDRDDWRARERELQAQVDRLTDTIVQLAKQLAARDTAAPPAPSSPSLPSPPPTRSAQPASPPSGVAADIARALQAVQSGVDVLSTQFDEAIASRPSAPAPLTPRPASPLRPPVPPAAASAGGALVSYEAAGSDSDEPGAGALPPDVEIPAGPPPVLSRGSDDIFWMHQLHQSLMHKGVYSGEDDVEMWFFGDSTQSAVLTFQACNDLEESGIVGPEEWAILLGTDARPMRWGENGKLIGPLEGGAGQQGQGGGADGAAGAGQAKEGDPVADFFARFGGVSCAKEGQSGVGGPEPRPSGAEGDGVPGKVAEGGKSKSGRSFVSGRASLGDLNEWPVLREGDGGPLVHKMQLALRHAGFYPEDDDTAWWNFGESTAEALRVFQACNDLPESGVCTAATWKALLKDEGAKPSDIARVSPRDSIEEEFENDLAGTADTHSEQLYLMGEQRWEDKKSNP